SVILTMRAALAAQGQDLACDRSALAPLERMALDARDAREYPLAEQRFREAFKVCPEKRSILLDLAQAQISGRNFDDAVRTARLYLASDSKSTAGRVMLANAYLMSLRLKDALAEANVILQDH